MDERLQDIICLEQLVGDMKWRKLRAIVVDEALTVIQCGKSQDKKTEPI